MGIRKALDAWRKKIPYCSAVIVAAGTASRMQGIDKVMAKLSGEPLLLHTIRAFEACSLVQEVVVVTRQDLLQPVADLCAVHGSSKVKAIVTGGENRTASVIAGLDHVAQKKGLVAIHDGARPLLEQQTLEAVIQKAAKTGAAAPAIPVKDTIKVAEGGFTRQTPDRKRLFAVQTPQVFDFDLIRGALQRAQEKKLSLTDDCAAVEAMGMPVCLTDGSERNFKVTTPMDLVLAEAILAQEALS